MARAGRKRKSVVREPNGRPQRAQKQTAEQDAMSVAVEYRQKVFGVSPNDVLDQKASTLIGRLCLQGTISEAQWQAGEEWGRLVNARFAHVNAPRGFKTATAGGGFVSDEEHARRVVATKEKFDNANKAVEGYAPPIECKERFKALRTIIIDQIMAPEMYGSLRIALNGLAKHFGYVGRKAA